MKKPEQNPKHTNLGTLEGPGSAIGLTKAWKFVFLFFLVYSKKNPKNKKNKSIKPKKQKKTMKQTQKPENKFPGLSQANGTPWSS